ncbi:MAG: magnesium transporter [Myxococcaceae bacterium]
MLGTFLKPECEELIRAKNWSALREVFSELDGPDIAEIIEDLPSEESALIFRLLPRDVAADVFEYLPLEQQTVLVQTLGSEQLANVLNEMAPDDRTRLLEELPAEVTRRLLRSLSPEELKVARQLLGYPEDTAGRRMTPEYLAVRPDMTASEALAYVRLHGKDRETLNVIFIVDERGHLLGDFRLASLVLAPPDAKVETLEDRQLISIPANTNLEEVVQTFEKYDRVALPVTDTRGILVGIITVDDVLDVAEERATEDIQRLGGMEALEAPYFDIGIFDMVRKRAGWLAILFVAQTLTTSVMGYFETELAQAVVLTLFIPLIISSGGNSGSQATSLIVRAMAVREIELRDWMRVLGREVVSGLALGAFLGVLGVLRVVFWPDAEAHYGEHFVRVGVTAGLSVLGVVLFGSVTGAMLPMLLRRLGLDPAAASAPFVATLVDVTGLVIYFSVALLVLRGTLL